MTAMLLIGHRSSQMVKLIPRIADAIRHYRYGRRVHQQHRLWLACPVRIWKSRRVALGDDWLGRPWWRAAPRYSGFAIDYNWTGRVDDSIKYKGSFGPVTVAGMFSITYDTGYGGEVPGAQTTGRFYSGSMNFAQGPIAATVLYEQRNSNTVQTATASALIGHIGTHAQGFISGRHLAAYLGLVPRQHSSGGKQRLAHISKSV
jgi:hypothetical protein